MFTLEQINNVHARLGKQSSLHDYLSALHALGVMRYDSFLSDGHSEYYGKDGTKIVSEAEHEKHTIAATCNKEGFLEHLRLHEQGKTDYFEMSKGLAGCGIEKWTFDTENMSITYYDLKGNDVLSEAIKPTDNES
jgi:uncharacterized protein YbcV (DUF1398 family)